MPNIDKEWVVRQLIENKIDPKIGDAVVALIKTWSEINMSATEAQKKAVQIFSKLSMGQPIVSNVNSDEKWVVARPGNIRVGDEVMVRSDAFQGEAGQLHNGRRGRVVAVRYGDIIVNSTDNIEPEIKGAHYSPYHLNKLVR